MLTTGMTWSTSNRIVQNAAQFAFSPPLGKSLNIIENIEGLSLVDTSFAPRDRPRPVKKKTAMSPSFTGHGGQCDTVPNIHSLTIYCERYSRGRELVFFFCLNQPVANLQNVVVLSYVCPRVGSTLYSDLVRPM